MLKRYINILLIIAFFCWVFHVTLDGCNASLKKRWGSQGLTRYSDRASLKHHGNVLCFVKALEFQGEINNSDLMHATSPDLSYRFSIMKQP